MQQRQTIRDIKTNDEVHSVFVIGTASLQQSRNGPYWRLELRDATGSLEAKIWSPLSAAFSDLAAGQMVDVSGRTSLFRDQIQVTVDALRPLTEEERDALNLADFMPASPRPPADMLAEAEALCRAELTHGPWRDFALSVLEDDDIRARLLTAPAAKSVHHAYVGGLLEHMLSVAGLCLRMADHYPELDRQTLLAAALFHDIGKLDEMSGGLTTDYTDAGRLLGHIVQGLALLEPFLAASGLEPELALHFRHLIASHHGELEFGAPRQPATAEAFALHHADNVDAKIAQWRGLFPVHDQARAGGEDTRVAEGAEGTPGKAPALSREEAASAPADAGLEWSPWQHTLSRSLCRPARTPEGAATPEPGKKSGRGGKKTVRKAAPADADEAGPAPAPKPRDDRQCSLL